MIQGHLSGILYAIIFNDRNIVTIQNKMFKTLCWFSQNDNNDTELFVVIMSMILLQGF
jgi:hypothetical protein